MIQVSVRDGIDLAALADPWRDLERRSEASFFLSWTWIGCLAEERFPDPVLVEATENGRVVALALFNRVRRWGLPVLYLHESGDRDRDCPYIEHNGVLTEAGREAELSQVCLRAIVRRYRVVLSGVGDTCRDAVRTVAAYARVRQAQPAYFADLDVPRQSGCSYLASLGSNTRQQIRRSERYFTNRPGGGALTVAAAASIEEGRAMLDSLADFHQATWRSRGKPGAFATPFFRRFHRALIEDGLPAGVVMLQRIAAGDTVIGYLYNFRFRNKIAAYQSGFHYGDPIADARPGLIAHAAAIQESLTQGIRLYDFLAGDDRYKRSLSHSRQDLSWMEAGPSWSRVPWQAESLEAKARGFLRRGPKAIGTRI